MAGFQVTTEVLGSLALDPFPASILASSDANSDKMQAEVFSGESLP
jgi:hypothetical protein